MHTRTEYPHAVRVIDNTWIPMLDGTRLAARIWLPVDAEEHPVPAVLEYIPYRKDDGTTIQDYERHPYFAGHGYAAVRVDLRGSGDSDGILEDEYLPQEQLDCLEVLAWLEAQPWCTGSVGMIGYSWGGFNGLQVAARRPPQLKAIITGCSTDDRYTDDCHYMGGCLLASDMLKWASTMLLYNGHPPDPTFVGDAWRDMWLERLRNTPDFIDAWTSHQRYDDFWKQGSVAEDYSAIQCAVLAVGGWADAYTNAIPRLLEHLECPRAGLIGPWAHMLPYRGIPGPAIGFLQECVRWWDRWLKGIDNGVDGEPMLRAWMQEPVVPARFYAERPGRWVTEETWPAPGIEPYALVLGAEGTLSEDPPHEPVTLHFQGSQSCGVQGGVWCANGHPDELPDDQAPDDAVSLTFDTDPLGARLEILGFPELILAFAVDRPLAIVAARLCAVAPDGASTLLSWGLLNLTHRDRHENPTPLVPGERYTARFRLNALGQAVEAGQRLRLAITPTYWPHAWPSPEPVELTVFADGESAISLPLRRPRDVEALVVFEPPETAAPLTVSDIEPAYRNRTVTRDAATGVTVTEDHEGYAYLIGPTATISRYAQLDRYEITEGDPLSAVVRCEREAELTREGWDVRLTTSSVMTASATHFHVTDVIEAFEAGERVFADTRECSIPRDLV
ncbi:MAG: CocE/NonD family hydrolase [Coriobacteriia bacterium]